MGKPQMHIISWKEPIWKGCMHSVRFQVYGILEKAKLWQEIWNQRLLGVEGRVGGIDGWIGETDNFKDSKNTLYDIIIVKTCHHAFVQTHIMQHQEWTLMWTMDSGWLWLPVYRFIHCHKGTILVRDVDNREGYACVGAGKSLYFFLNFSVNLKLLKNEVLKKRKNDEHISKGGPLHRSKR